MTNEMQDWTPIVFNKKRKTTQQTYVDPQIIKLNKIDNIDDEQPLKHETVNDDIRKIIIKLRNQKKINQKTLANNLNLKEDIIKSIEDGTHLKNNQLFGRIKRYLESLPDPK